MRTATRLIAPVVLGLLFTLSTLGQHSAEAAGRTPKVNKSNMSQTRYTGKRRLSRAANGAGSSFMNRDQGLVASLGGKPITNRRVKVTKLSVKKSATSTNHTYRVDTIAKKNGQPAASTVVTVADFAVKGPKGGRAKEARFFQRKDPRITKASPERSRRRASSR
jgi:hypothetical protein